jgi:hypothetical protein
MSAGAPMPPEPTDPSTALLVAFTRLEAKVDVALGDHANRLESQGRDLADHENRLRAIEARPVIEEKRVRDLELRPTVTPAGLWSAVLGAATVVGVAVTVWTNLNA